MVAPVGPLGAVANLLGLKRTLKQEELAADLAQQAQQNQKQANASTEVIDPSNIDPNAPVRRGQIVDIIA